MSGLVIDASVALKWYIPEPHSGAASGLLDTPARLMVPGLFYAEFGNALWKLWRRGELEHGDIGATLESLERVPFEVFPTRGLAAHAVEIALDHGCTVYDGVYVALAALQEGTMITADRKLIKKLATSALAYLVVPVETVGEPSP